MKMKKFFASLLCLAMLANALPISALALDAGVYTASVVTSYYNPDTGNVDDGGTANAALGDGMCRSATAKTGLVEKDADGNIWVTIRLLLQSNCKNVAFYTRTGYDTYSQVSYDIMAEDSAKDSIDYRFKVSDAGVKIKGTMYVTPMGRDVLWYLYVDASTLTSGSGDFEVSIDVNEPEITPAPSEPAAPTPSPATPAPAVSEEPSSSAPPATDNKTETTPSPSAFATTAPETTPAPSASATAAPETTPSPSASATAASETTPDNSPANPTASNTPAVMPEEPVDNTETQADEAVPETPLSSEGSQPMAPEQSNGTEADDASTQKDTQEAPGEPEQESGRIGSGVIAAIVVVAVIAAGTVLYLFKRRKK